MKRLIAILALALVIPACMHKTQTEQRWSDLNGREVILMDGYEKVVHASPDCSRLKSERGTQVKCKVKDGRLVDQNGEFKNAPESRLALCTCVP
jgi:signal transduction protein with GAF and PtsI domain